MAVTPDTPNTNVVINYKANNSGTPDTPVTPPVDPGDNSASPSYPACKARAEANNTSFKY